MLFLIQRNTTTLPPPKKRQRSRRNRATGCRDRFARGDGHAMDVVPTQNRREQPTELGRWWHNSPLPLSCPFTIAHLCVKAVRTFVAAFPEPATMGRSRRDKGREPSREPRTCTPNARSFLQPWGAGKERRVGGSRDRPDTPSIPVPVASPGGRVAVPVGVGKVPVVFVVVLVVLFRGGVGARARRHVRQRSHARVAR